MSESTRNHKRKRRLQESPVDLTKMKMAMRRVRALKEELAGIEETEGEMEALMTHVNSLEEILRGAKKPVRGFLLVMGHEGIVANTPVDQPSRTTHKAETKYNVTRMYVLSKPFFVFSLTNTDPSSIPRSP